MNEIERQKRYEADWEQPPIPTDKIEMIRATACEKCSKGLLLAYIETLLSEIDQSRSKPVEHELLQSEDEGIRTAFRILLMMGRAYVRAKQCGYTDSLGEVAMKDLKQLLPDAFSKTGVFRDFSETKENVL